MGPPVQPDPTLVAAIHAAEPYAIPPEVRAELRRYQERQLDPAERAAIRAHLRAEISVPPASLAAAIRTEDAIPPLDYLGLHLERCDADGRYAMVLINDPDPVMLARAVFARCARGAGLDAFLARAETRQNRDVIRAGVETLATVPGRAITAYLREVCTLPTAPEYLRTRAAIVLAYRWEHFTLGEALGGGEERLRPGLDASNPDEQMAFHARYVESGEVDMAIRLRTDPDCQQLVFGPLGAPGANIHTLRAATERAVLCAPPDRAFMVEAIVASLDNPVPCPRFHARLAPWVGGWPLPAYGWRNPAYLHAGYCTCAEELRSALAKDSSAELRELAPRVAQLDSASPMPPTGALPAEKLALALAIGEPDTRRTAITLASWQPSPPVAVELAGIVRRGRKAERELALYALAADPSEVAERALVAASDDTWPAVRTCALAALAARGGENAVAVLSAAIHCPDPATRTLALVLLAGVDSPVAFAVVRTSLLEIVTRAEAARLPMG